MPVPTPLPLPSGLPTPTPAPCQTPPSTLTTCAMIKYKTPVSGLQAQAIDASVNLASAACNSPEFAPFHCARQMPKCDGNGPNTVPMCTAQCLRYKLACPGDVVTTCPFVNPFNCITVTPLPSPTPTPTPTASGSPSGANKEKEEEAKRQQAIRDQQTMEMGLGIGAGGLVLAAVGVVWYRRREPRPKKRREVDNMRDMDNFDTLEEEDDDEEPFQVYTNRE
eukprot:TRINITY_DN4695_c0_g1_i1.p1 TRINITY_DN4695_c0_g1~~TRINITY_DN4695_c0_g1_i1.p1  ORF type:complete len:222 (+),score=54.98 TRINITY_DN4695_c0_g1_i1:269-934(+)